ncbi:MAG: TRAP transporter small permease subunit [Rhodospirillaceae bacterium]|nr:TRAP transporter small permease subunit [Rhodospirillaceae bacterium]
MLTFLFNNYLIFWLDWPGLAPFFEQLEVFGPSALKKPLEGTAFLQAAVQAAFYPLAVVIPAVVIQRTAGRTLRGDSLAMAAIVNYIIRAAFWIVLLIGLADMVISFLRVEELLSAVVGDDLTKQLGRPHFRGAYTQIPLMVAGLIIAAFTRSLGFHWLALLVVLAEMSIVLSRFIFSYEQAFQGDLVRFWYAGLFLFASAYTLFEDGHVRVDVLYAGFKARQRGLVNALGSLLLGLTLCWVILVIGMGQKASIINAPLMNFEVSQSGFGMYVKYMMAGFLAVFAITMMIQFASYILESIADYRDEPGRREIETDTVQ